MTHEDKDKNFDRIRKGCFIGLCCMWEGTIKKTLLSKYTIIITKNAKQ